MIVGRSLRQIFGMMEMMGFTMVSPSKQPLEQPKSPCFMVFPHHFPNGFPRVFPWFPYKIALPGMELPRYLAPRAPMVPGKS